MASGLFSSSELDKVESNRVSYKLYIDPAFKAKALAALTDDTEPHTTTRHPWLGYYLASLCCRIQKLTSPWTRDYLWHHEPFSLRPAQEHHMEGACLKGKTDFGDAMDDEWFIVFLLYTISESMPECIISVDDNDGQFLLIEAADLLPSWIDAETSLNRVFIYCGRLHIIPRSVKADPALSLKEAIATIVNPTLLTEASQAIQDRIQEKLAEFRHHAYLKSHYHHAVCKVPKRIAYSLSKNPCLVSDAVDALMRNTSNTFPSSLKPLSLHDFSFKLPVDEAYESPSGDGWLMTTVRFTRLMFAQILSQRLPPSPRMASALGRLVPNSRDYLATELGLKLTLGFELLLRDRASSAAAPGPLSPYMSAELLQAWSRLYPNQIVSDLTVLDTWYSRIAGTRRQRVSELLDTLLSEPVPENALLYVNTSPADATDWLNVDPSELEQRLHETRGPGPATARAARTEGHHKKARVTFDEENLAQTWKSKMEGLKTVEDMTRHFESFLERESDYEGIELSDDENDSDSDDMSSDEEGFYSDSDADTEESKSPQESDMDLEQEILETIRHDPDLLMKMIEKSQECGMDYKELLEKLKSMSFEFDRDLKQQKAKDMDEELSARTSASTGAGNSSASSSSGSDSSDEDGGGEFMEHYYESMQQELQSLYKKHSDGAALTVQESESESEEEDSRPDGGRKSDRDSAMPSTFSSSEQLQMHVVKNMLSGFEAQEGRSGPSSTLFSSMGIFMPRNDDH